MEVQVIDMRMEGSWRSVSVCDKLTGGSVFEEEVRWREKLGNRDGCPQRGERSRMEYLQKAFFFEYVRRNGELAGRE